MTPLGFQTHDHGSCIDAALKAADETCQKEGWQLTPVRRRVLEILLQHHKAMGAYEILEVLRSEGLGSQPPVAYRALDFLMKRGFAHKIERLNAFVACTQPDAPHDPAFLICRSCDHVAETDSDATDGPLKTAAKTAGFAIEQAVIEAEGLCPKCQDTPS